MSRIIKPISASYKFFFLGLLLALTFLPAQALAQNDHSWYVSNNGSDNNNGWTTGTARKTLHGGILDSLGPGDTLYIMGGRWGETADPDDGGENYIKMASFDLSHIEGTGANPIVIRNYPGTFPEIWGDGGVDSPWTRNGVTFYDSKNIILDSLRITHNFHYGVIFRGGCENITVQHCQIDSNYIESCGDNGGGVYLGAMPYGAKNYYCNVMYNHIFDNNYSYPDFLQCTNAPGVGGYGNRHGIIRGNIIHGHTGAAGVKFKGFDNDSNIVDSNVIYDGGVGVEINGGCDTNIVRYNLIYNVTRGIYFYTYGSASSDHNVFHNNTVYGMDRHWQGVSFGLGNSWSTATTQPAQHINLFNNIFCNIPMSSTGGPLTFLDVGQTFDFWDNNLWFGTSGSQTDVVNWNEQHMTLAEHVSAHGIDNNSIWADPQFLSTNPQSADFLKISTTSPAATSGRGGAYPTYMGAFNPFSSAHISVSPNSLAFAAQPNGTPPESKSFSITNAGAGTLEWSISDNAGWLSVDPVSGSSNSQVVSVYINDTDLPVGQYNAAITISSSNADNSPQTVSVSYKIDGTPPIDVGDLDGY